MSAPRSRRRSRRPPRRTIPATGSSTSATWTSSRTQPTWSGTYSPHSRAWTPRRPRPCPSACRTGDPARASTSGRSETRASSTAGSRCWNSRIHPPDAPRPRRWTARTSTAGPCGPARVSRSSRRRRRWTRRRRTKTKPPSRPARNDARTTGGSDADASSATPRRWRRDSTPS